MTFIDPSIASDFAGRFPLLPATLRHGLADHPLLTLDALADAAGRLPAEHVERRVRDAGKGGRFAKRDWDGADAAALVGDAAGDSWIMLRFVEQLPDYCDLLHRLMAEIEPATASATGSILDVRGFIFISAPGTLTPFHFDAEYNILFQIAGDKVFATYPPEPPFLHLDQRETYHLSGDNMLRWQDGFDARATLHRLDPGDALYVPYAAPHWVRAGARPSISLSLTWQSLWSLRAADALAFNPMLRRLGLPGPGLPAWPRTPHLRSLCHRIARRAGLA